MFRALCYYVLLAITAIPNGLACVVTWPVLSAPVRYDWFVATWMRFAVKAAEVICGLRYEVHGAENLPPQSSRSVVFCKHQSAWETLFLLAWLPNRVGYVYKQSLHWIPFFGWAMKSMPMVPIDRANGRKAYEQILEGGRRLLDRGWWLCIFPEGTRVAPGETGNFKTGGARFVVREKALVIPIALNSGEFWPRNSLRKTPGTIVVSIGPAIDSTGLEYAELNEKASTWIENETRRIGNPQFYA